METKSETVKKDTGLFFESETCEIVFSTSKTMATSTIDANPGDNSILEDDNDPDLSLETGDDPELEAIKARVRQMEEEAAKLKQMQSEVDKQMTSPAGSASALDMSYEEKVEVDARSVYVGNVDYGATAEELEQHFHGCGAVNRVTILCNKFDGHPKGFAYIEFTEKDSIQMAMALDESLFRGRQLKVMPKRTNKPGITTSNRPPRGGSRRPRGRGSFYSGYRPTRRPSRGRRYYYSPY